MDIKNVERSQLLTQLDAKQHDPGHCTKIIAGHCTNSNLSTKVTVRIPIDKQVSVSTLLITPNFKTEMLLFTTEILKTNSLLFLHNNSLFVS